MLKRLALGLSLALLSHGVVADTAEPQTTPAPTAAAEQATDPETAAAEAEAVAAYQRMQDIWRKALLPVFDKLRLSTAPRDWVLASQMHQLGDDDPASNGAARAELLKNAVTAAPDDVLVQWIAAMAMPSTGGGGCSAPQRLPANMDDLLRLESANGLAWLPLLRQSYQDNDALGVDAALARIAAADRYDDHRLEHKKLLVKLYAEHPQVAAAVGAAFAVLAGETDETTQASMDFGSIVLQSETVMVSLYTLNKVCDPSQEPAPETRRLALCADIGQRLAERGVNSRLRHDGESLLERLGLSQGKLEALEREQLYLAWMLYQSADQKQAEAIFRREWESSGDPADALRATVKALGLPTTPPVTWQPPPEFDALLNEATDPAHEAPEQDGSEAAAAAEPTAGAE